MPPSIKPYDSYLTGDGMKQRITEYCGRWRITQIVIGGVYEFRPLNRQATRNRGRMCELIDYYDDPFLENPFANAKVRWADSGRITIIDASALIHASDNLRSDDEMEAEAKEQAQRIKLMKAKEAGLI